MRARLAAGILILFANSVSGQTAADIEMKYGKPVAAYSVSEHIWMTPEYTVDGRVCQMRLYPKRIAADVDYLSSQLPFEELKGVLNQLAPPHTLGAQKESFGITTTGGGVAWTTYPYEKVTFTFTFPFRIDAAYWKEVKTKEAQTYDFSVQENLSYGKPMKTAPRDDDFSPSQTSKAEIVTIKWNDRKCAAK